MPLAATTYMLLVRPTPQGDSDLWGDELNTLLGLVDGHRHIPNEGRQIPSAGIGIDADLSFANHRLTSVAGLAMQNLGAPLAAGTDELFVDGNNLKFRNAGGVNVRITNGNALDVTTVGAIAGDYTAVGAEVAFTDSADIYTFKQQVGAAVRQFAKMQCADIALTEYKAQPAAGVPANAVTLMSPAALAAPYSLTMPTVLPGGQSLVTVSAAGALAAATSVPIDITLAANKSVTVSGTGEFKHGDLTIVLPASLGEVDGVAQVTGTTWYFSTANGFALCTNNANAIYEFGIPLKIGDRIKTIKAMIKDTVGAHTVTMKLYENTSAGAAAQVGATQTSAGDGTNQTLSLTGLTTTLVSGKYYQVRITSSDATCTTHTIYGVEVTYDRP